MCDAPIGTASWSPAKKWNCFQEFDVTGAEVGATSQQTYPLISARRVGLVLINKKKELTVS